MMNKNYLLSAVLGTGLIMVASLSTASDKEAPMADASKMMMEHVGMDCTVCHGANGPKGFDMGKHPKQSCTDCHSKGTTKVLARKDKKTTLAREMMLKHGAALQCKLCHGEHGAGGKMMLEHVGMDCQTCHVVGDK